MFTPADPTLPAILMAPHRMATRVDVYLGEELIRANLPITSGASTATLGTRTGRAAEFTINRAELPYLSPLGARIIAYTGVADVEMVPVFEGRIDAVNDDGRGQVRVTCQGRGQDIQDARFEVPYAVAVGSGLLANLSTLLVGGSVGASVTVEGVAESPASVLVYEEDRGEACDDLARALQALWQEDRTGGFRIFPNPFSLPVPPVMAALLRDGANGTIVTIDRTTSRTLIRNSVTIVVERTDGSAPIRATARDLDPMSPTYWGGSFGQQNLIVKSQAPLTPADAGTLARRLLGQSLALQRAWRISMPHYPLLDPGDYIGVWWNDEVSGQIIESVTYPWTADLPATIATREWHPLTEDMDGLVLV